MGKVILVAKNQAAMEAINYDREEPDQVLKLELTDDELNYFFKSGLVYALNDVCKTLIDNFEDDHIIGRNNLRSGLTLLETYQYRDNRYSAFIGNLITLFQEAFTRDTAIYFYF